MKTFSVIVRTRLNELPISLEISLNDAKRVIRKLKQKDLDNARTLMCVDVSQAVNAAVIEYNEYDFPVKLRLYKLPKELV